MLIPVISATKMDIDGNQLTDNFTGENTFNFQAAFNGDINGFVIGGDCENEEEPAPSGCVEAECTTMGGTCVNDMCMVMPTPNCDADACDIICGACMNGICVIDMEKLEDPYATCCNPSSCTMMGGTCTVEEGFEDEGERLCNTGLV